MQTTLEMQKSHSLVLVSLLLSLAAPVIAELPPPWFLVAADQEGNQTFLNMQQITHKEGIVTYMELDKFGVVNASGIASIMSINTGSCLYNLSRVETAIAHDRNENQVLVLSRSDVWKTQKPGTVGYAILQMACEVQPLR